VPKAKTPTTPKQPAAPAALPAGWRMVRFGEVVRDVNQACRDPQAQGLERFIGLEHIDPENLHVRRWGLLADTEVTFTKRFRKGQVLFGKRRAYQRKVAVAEFDGICSSDILTFEPKGDDLIPELLPFIVQSDGFFDHALNTSAGSLSPRTRWSQLADYEFPLPPKDEQCRIAEILWAADEAVHGYAASRAHLVQLLEVMLRDFLQRGWQQKRSEDLYLVPPRNGISPPPAESGNGFPTLSIGAVKNGLIVTENNLKYAQLTPDELNQFRLNRGDILVVRGNGNRDLCGRCGVVREVPENCFYPDLLIRVVFDSSIILPNFACLQWNASSVHRRLLSRAKSTNGIWKVNGKDLRDHTLAVPPIEEQQSFVMLIREPQLALECIDTHIQGARAANTHLRSSLLSGAKHVQ
jgi:type I restriction enzyme, S subunit